MDQNIIEKFTTHLKSVLVRAYTLAHELGEDTITPDHLLWSLLTERGCLGAEILQKSKLSHEKIREEIAKKATEKTPKHALAGSVQDVGEIPLPTLADTTKNAIEKAVLTANIYEHKYVGTEHLLSGILQIEDTFLSQLLSSLQVDVNNLKSQVTVVLKSTSKFPDIGEGAAEMEPNIDGVLDEEKETSDEENGEKKRTKKSGSKTPALDFFTVDLTGSEAQKRIDPVIGREKEIERMIQILCRRTKNNPVLLGDPGVGKTAIVEGLARRIVENTVPEVLRGKRILALDLALVVAGTVYRGEFEGRVKQIIDEVKAQPNVILFIDEVHNITGTGSTSGSMDAANILKPALARGDIRCIGATTHAEYKKFIEADPALDRRFQPIIVLEPSTKETVEILRGVRSQYENFHRLTISDEAIDAAVKFAERYLQEKTFPDKAIDLIDEAASAARVKNTTNSSREKIQELEKELKRIQTKKQQAVHTERFAFALQLKEKELALINQIESVLKTEEQKTSPRVSIGAKHIAAIVSRITGIPDSTILAQETEELEDLEKRLTTRVVGQEHVIKDIVQHMKRARAGLTKMERPLASFLFLGPSGVGKTSLATAIAEEVFHDPKALIHLDMSEFGEAFTVSKMLGAPAGYVGYRDSNKLTDAVKRRPYSVILFDEVEKAHPDVLHILLQTLENGRLTDSTGRAVRFTQAVIILTSNVGSNKFATQPVGFATGNAPLALAADVRKEAQHIFRPELLNRLDSIFVFNKLARKDLDIILRNELSQFNKQLSTKNLSVTVTKSALGHIADLCNIQESGARAIRHIFQQHIEVPLAEHMLAGAMKKKKTFAIDARKGKLTYNVR